MALELKRKSKIYLKSERVEIEDNSPLSEEFFGLNDFPKYFGEGKNSFRIRPRVGSLKPNTRIDVEVIDANGNPIYWEIPSYKDDDQSRLISVWVYDVADRKYNTPDGTCEVIIVGTLPNGQLVRWTRRIDVVKNKKSVSEIVFKTPPTIEVSSSIETFINKSQSGNKLTKVLASGSIKYIKSIYGDDVSLQGSQLTSTTTTTLSGISASFLAEPLVGEDSRIGYNPSNVLDNSPSFPDFYNNFEENGDSRIYIYSSVQAFRYLGSKLRTALVDTFDADRLILADDYTIHPDADGATPTYQLIPQSGLATLDDEFTTSSIEISIVSESLSFNGEMLSGSIELDLSDVTLFPRLTGGQSQPTRITASITEIVSSNIIRISPEITASDNRSEGSIHTYEYSDGAFGGLVRYFSTGSDIATENQIAFVNIDLTNVKPISGRIDSVITSIKSQGLSNSEYETIGNTKVKNNSIISYKVPVPTEQLKDPKTLRVQFVNSSGQISSTELIVEDVIFDGGNVYIGGNQSIVTGSFHIGNAIGTGIEMAGHSSGYLRSIGYDGFTSASLGKGPGGFLLFSGSGNLVVGEDTYDGVGLDLVANSESYFRYTTQNGGNLDIRTDSFFIGSPDLQFISGADANIEISSSLFHLDPQNDSLIIGANATILADLTANEIRTPAQIGGVQSTRENASSSIDSDGFARFVSASIGGFEISDNQINSTNDLLILKSNGQITASAALISGSGIQVDTPNFIIDSEGDVEANAMILRDSSLADAFSFRFVTINSSNVSSYLGTYSGSDGNVYCIMDLSGESSVIDNTTQGASYVRFNVDPTYPIGSIIHPYLHNSETNTTNRTIASTLTIESGIPGVKFAIDANGKSSGTGAKRIYSYDGTTELVDQSSKSVATINYAYIDNNRAFYDKSIEELTKSGYTYDNIIQTNSGQQFTLGRNFFAWKILGASEYDTFSVGNRNFVIDSNGEVTSSTHVPDSSNAYDLGSTSLRWRTIYSINALNTSDRNEKKNISGSDLGLTFINSLNPVKYNWIWDNDDSPKHYGLIAQEVDEIVSNENVALVHQENNNWSMAYNELISPMIKAIQELSDEVNQLKLQLSQSQG